MRKIPRPWRPLKNFTTKLAEVAAQDAQGSDIEIWFQDEARIGQKNKITRRWAKRGTRPSAPYDQRTRSAYIFCAICPKEGKSAGLVARCNAEAMTLHLREISRAVIPGAHAVVLLDQTGWHGSKGLEVPDNITLLPLPPRSPEPTPVVAAIRAVKARRPADPIQVLGKGVVIGKAALKGGHRAWKM